jgi:hypothetical protein
MTDIQRLAEKIVQQTYCQHQNESDRVAYKKLIVEEIEAFLSEAMEEARDKFYTAGQARGVLEGQEQAYTRAAEVARTFTEGRQCQPDYEGHDDRWCSVCENAKDAADVIAAAIEKLKEEK